MSAREQARLHQSFLSIERFRYALYALALAGVCTAAYEIDGARERPHGDTVIGYTLGGITTALVLFLMGYGIRRRTFGVRAGSARRWLSLHTYFGWCALALASLHCAFEFGWNIHTLAYALLALVVLSGTWGVYAYWRYPGLITQARGSLAREELMARLHELDAEAVAVAAACETTVRDLITDAVRRTRLGGGVFAQLSARDACMLEIVPWREHGFSALVGNRGQRALIAELAKHQVMDQSPVARQALHRLLQLGAERAMLIRRIQRDIQLQGLLQIWLYVHLPLSFAMLAALSAHVFSVFYYW